MFPLPHLCVKINTQLLLSTPYHQEISFKDTFTSRSTQCTVRESLKVEKFCHLIRWSFSSCRRKFEEWHEYGCEGVTFVCSLKQQEPASHSVPAGAQTVLFCPHMTENTKETSVFLFHSCANAEFRVCYCLCHLQQLLCFLSSPSSASKAQSYL